MRSAREVERLVEQNRRLVEYIVNRYLQRYRVGSMEREDLVSWGLVGLVNAARAWDPSRNIAFSTLACRAIERMIIRGVNREARPDRQPAVSLDELLSPTDGGEERFVDQLRAPESVEGEILDRESLALLHRALGSLPADQRDLITRHYLRDERVRDIAGSLGITRQGLYSREKAILKRLREDLQAAAIRTA